MINATELERRVSRLTAALASFAKAIGYSSDPGPHRVAIQRRRQLGSAAAAVADPSFLASLRETLRDWGIGVRASRLVDEDLFARRLQAAVPTLEPLEGLRLDEKSPDEAELAALIHAALWAVADVVTSQAKWVAATKTLHHLLPDLVVPVDGTYTAGFLRGSQDLPNMTTSAIESFFRTFRRIAIDGRAADLVEDGTWNSSISKVVDNGIIGYWRLLLQRLDVPALQRRLRDFAAERDWDQFHSPKNLAMALAGEAGELVSIFQWLTEDESRGLSDDDLRRVQEEIADIQIYLLRLADLLGISLGGAVDNKISLNEEKYPPELSRGNAIKYDRRSK